MSRRTTRQHDAGSSERQEMATALCHVSGGIWPGVGGGHLLFAEGAQLIMARVTVDGAEAWLPGLAYGHLAGVGCSLLASPFGTRMEERVGVIGRRGIPPRQSRWQVSASDKGPADLYYRPERPVRSRRRAEGTDAC